MATVYKDYRGGWILSCGDDCFHHEEVGKRSLLDRRPLDDRIKDAACRVDAEHLRYKRNRKAQKESQLRLQALIDANKC